MLAQVTVAQPAATPPGTHAMAYAPETSVAHPVPTTAARPAAPKPTRLAADTHTTTRGLRVRAQGDSPDESTDIDQDESQSSGVVVRKARITMARSTSAWLRVVTLAPSASKSMQVKSIGSTDDVGVLRGYFIKPRSVIANSFGSDATPGMSVDSFSGSAVARLEVTSF